MKQIIFTSGHMGQNWMNENFVLTGPKFEPNSVDGRKLAALVNNLEVGEHVVIKRGPDA